MKKSSVLQQGLVALSLSYGTMILFLLLGIIDPAIFPSKKVTIIFCAITFISGGYALYAFAKLNKEYGDPPEAFLFLLRIYCAIIVFEGIVIVRFNHEYGEWGVFVIVNYLFMCVITHITHLKGLFLRHLRRPT